MHVRVSGIHNHILMIDYTRTHSGIKHKEHEDD